MDWIPQIFRRRKIYNDLSEEIRLHMEERTEQLMREGMSPKEAKQAAHLAFGNRTVVEERSREVWQWPTLESIVADCPLCPAPVAQISRFHHRRCFDAGVGNWGKRRCIRHHGWSGSAATECAAGGEPLRNSLWGQSHVAVVSQLHRPAQSQPQLRGPVRFQHGPGSGIRYGQRSDCRKRLCSDRQLLRRAAHSPLPWPFVPRIR